MALTVARVTFRAGAWTRRRDGLAALPVEMFVQDGIAMAPAIDLARELAARMGLKYGEDVVPEDALSAGVLSAEAARHVKVGSWSLSTQLSRSRSMPMGTRCRIRPTCA